MSKVRILNEETIKELLDIKNIIEVVEQVYTLKNSNQANLFPIVTATPSRKPLIKKEWVKKGTHFTCIGVDMEGKQEIDENIFSMARVFVDDINQATNVGETEIPIKKGIIAKENIIIIGEIGEVILGKVPGWVSKDDITIFDSTGIAHQDLLTAHYLIKIAKEKGLGTMIEL